MNLQQAYKVIMRYIDRDIPYFMHGAPGVGKSDVQRAIAVGLGDWPIIDFRCSTRDPVALMGLPDLQGDTAVWKAPDEFPQVERDGENGILFLDELNAAPPSMQAAAFGLVLDRRIGEYELPPGWRVAAAGNRQEDRAAAQRMPSPLANRFAHVDIDVDKDSWKAWAIEAGVSETLIAFIDFRPQLLHDMTGDLRAFPTPRSWTQVSKVIDEPDELRPSLVEGLVGSGATAELEGFIRVVRELPTVDEILADPKTAMVPTEPAAHYAISNALVRRADVVTFPTIMDYATRLPREFEIVIAIDALKSDASLKETRAFTDWAVRNQDVFK